MCCCCYCFWWCISIVFSLGFLAFSFCNHILFGLRFFLFFSVYFLQHTTNFAWISIDFGEYNMLRNIDRGDKQQDNCVFLKLRFIKSITFGYRKLLCPYCVLSRLKENSLACLSHSSVCSRLNFSLCLLAPSPPVRLWVLPLQPIHLAIEERQHKLFQQAKLCWYDLEAGSSMTTPLPTQFLIRHFYSNPINVRRDFAPAQNSNSNSISSVRAPRNEMLVLVIASCSLHSLTLSIDIIVEVFCHEFLIRFRFIVRIKSLLSIKRVWWRGRGGRIISKMFVVSIKLKRVVSN